MADTLVERDGLLYVRSDMVHYDAPKVTSNFYPVSDGYGGQVRASDFNREHIGKPVKYVSGHGFYRLERGAMLGDIIIRLPQGGQTQATFQETEDVTCPKVRRGIETRWRDGRWQKYLKTSGWVSA